MSFVHGDGLHDVIITGLYAIVDLLNNELEKVLLSTKKPQCQQRKKAFSRLSST